MNRFKALFAFFGVAAGMAIAEVPQRPDIAALLNLDSARAAKVEQILQAADVKTRFAREQIGPISDETSRVTMRAAMEAIRADTDEKLARVLSSDEMATLRAALPPPSPRFTLMHFRRG
jgi:hypothetical protein